MRTGVVLAIAVTSVSLAGCEDRGLSISRYDAEAIVKSGGGVTLSAERLSRYDLEAVAKAATETNAKVVIVKAARLSRYDMESIGKSGPGLVIFED